MFSIQLPSNSFVFRLWQCSCSLNSNRRTRCKSSQEVARYRQFAQILRHQIVDSVTLIHEAKRVGFETKESGKKVPQMVGKNSQRGWKNSPKWLEFISKLLEQVHSKKTFGKSGSQSEVHLRTSRVGTRREWGLVISAFWSTECKPPRLLNNKICL